MFFFFLLVIALPYFFFASPPLFNSYLLTLDFFFISLFKFNLYSRNILLS